MIIDFKKRENGIIKCSVKTTKDKKKGKSMNREQKQYEAIQNR